MRRRRYARAHRVGLRPNVGLIAEARRARLGNLSGQSRTSFGATMHSGQCVVTFGICSAHAGLVEKGPRMAIVSRRAALTAAAGALGLLALGVQAPVSASGGVATAGALGLQIFSRQSVHGYPRQGHLSAQARAYFRRHRCYCQAARTLVHADIRRRRRVADARRHLHGPPIRCPDPRVVHVGNRLAALDASPHESVGLSGSLGQWVRWVTPIRTTCPDEACPAPATWRVTVSVGKSAGDTPAHNVTSSTSLNVPIGTRTPEAFFSHAS